jgi:hypothetical protein
MKDIETYKTILSEVIAKQAIILGKEMALMRARNVDTLMVDDDGSVLEISGDPEQALRRLVDEYVALSGEIVQSALASIFVKYPQLKVPNTGEI